MTTYELISTHNKDFDIIRLFDVKTGEIIKDYFNRSDFFRDEKREVINWQLNNVKKYISIIIGV